MARTGGGGIALPRALAYWAAAHGCLGEVDQWLEVVERGIEQARRPGWLERAHLVELLRVKGILHRDATRIEVAEKVYVDSLAWAREQQARSWEPRTATSYARLMRSQGRIGEARKLLNSVYGWFTEGFDTRYLKDAKALLEELRQA